MQEVLEIQQFILDAMAKGVPGAAKALEDLKAVSERVLELEERASES